MHFVYPACLRPDCSGEIIVSFRDLPECLTSGADEPEAKAPFVQSRAGHGSPAIPESNHRSVSRRVGTSTTSCGISVIPTGRRTSHPGEHSP